MTRSAERHHICIVGAGFSGTMLAVHLAARGCRVTLIDRAGSFARGVAYSTVEDHHLLNVRASNMSAFADARDHFAEWLVSRTQAGPTTFAGRRIYGEYIAEMLHEHSASIEVLQAEVVGVTAAGACLSTGRVIAADALVIAAGNLPPEPLATFATATVPFVADPWSADGRRAMDVIAGDAGTVLVVGTGLTMIDTVLSLDARGYRGRIVAVSRRGLVPRAHAAAGQAVSPPEERGLLPLLRWLRAQASVAEWRAAVDALRPITAQIWQGWSQQEQSRFLRHARPWWDVHRHRCAPEIDARMYDLIQEGRLSILAGRVVSCRGDAVALHRRGRRDVEEVAVDSIINCTGASGDLSRSRDVLMRALLDEGSARADAFGLGLEVDDGCRIIDAQGDATPGLYAVGPITKGMYWEMVAVPDIRGQVEGAAEQIVLDLQVQAANERRMSETI